MRRELTTPKAILIGLSFVAIAIASIPYSKSVITKAHAATAPIPVYICGESGHCAGVNMHGALYTTK